MLKVQEYLQSGNTLEDLNREFAIKMAYHSVLPLVILNYDQIDSPKTHPIVRECRALTLDTRDHSIVARSFSRFFNWGEVADEMPLFDFSDFIVQTKEDGSLVLLYYHDGNWLANTRGSFAVDEMQGAGLTWQEGFCKAMGIGSLSDLGNFLDPTVSYVCEFCSPWNKVVRRYPEPTMFLLTAFQGERELTPVEVDNLASQAPLKRPQRFEFKSIEEIQDYLAALSSSDPTYEGVVICDKDGRRWKIKSATYLGLHKLRGEGDNLFNPKHLLPFILAGEQDEMLLYFNEVSEAFFQLKCRVQEMYIALLETWTDHRHIEDQKEFALAIKNKPFSSILFNLRKRLGSAQTSSDIRKAWRESETLILKALK